MNGEGLMTAQRAVERRTAARRSRRSRWLGTTWKMSPARMYSLAFSTIATYSARLGFEWTALGGSVRRGVAAGGGACGRGRARRERLRRRRRRRVGEWPDPAPPG